MWLRKITQKILVKHLVVLKRPEQMTTNKAILIFRFNYPLSLELPVHLHDAFIIFNADSTILPCVAQDRPPMLKQNRCFGPVLNLIEFPCTLCVESDWALRTLLRVPVHQPEKCSLPRNDIAAPLSASSVYYMLAKGEKRISECGKMSFVVLGCKATNHYTFAVVQHKSYGIMREFVPQRISEFVRLLQFALTDGKKVLTMTSPYLQVEIEYSPFRKIVH